MTTEELQVLEQTVGWKVAAWTGHPDFDDLKQEARIAAWQAVEEARAQGKTLAVNTVAGRAAHWKALDFLRSRQATRRVLRPGQTPGVTFVPLDSLWDDQREDYEPGDHQKRTPQTGDFAPALIETLNRAAIVGEVLALCFAGQAEAVQACCLDGQSVRDYAAAMGVNPSAIHQRLRRVFDRYREWALTGRPEESGC